MCRVLNGLDRAEKSRVLIATDNDADSKRAASEFPHLVVDTFAHNRVAFLRRFTRLALTQRFDLVLVGHVNYASMGWASKKLNSRVRYGVMLYGIEAWERLPHFKRIALKEADFFISISEYTKDRAVQANGLNPDRIHVLPNALERTDLEPAGPTPSLPALNRTRLLTVCRLDDTERYKGVDKVIEALPAVAEFVPGVKYVVVGGGSDLERHQRLAESLGVADRVQFLGFLSQADLHTCYRECDLFVMPSAGEGFGFVFLEAMRYGKAVVAAASGGAPEVVEDGVTGRLVEYGDEKQLAACLVDLCLDTTKRRGLGHAGWQRLNEKFTFPQFKQKLTEILLQELPADPRYKLACSDDSASCAS